MNDMQFSAEEEARLEEEQAIADMQEEEDFLQELADLEYEEFYQQELERDERAREIAEENE